MHHVLRDYRLWDTCWTMTDSKDKADQQVCLLSHVIFVVFFVI